MKADSGVLSCANWDARAARTQARAGGNGSGFGEWGVSPEVLQSLNGIHVRVSDTLLGPGSVVGEGISMYGGPHST